MNKDFNHSYWEKKHLRSPFDLIVVGCGIVGLSTAISYKQKHTKAKVLILERGILPNGASTKNAGFACFGSAGELLSDLKNGNHSRVWETVNMRWEGLNLLRNRLKDKNLDYKPYGGFELFDNLENYEYCLAASSTLNKQLKSIIGKANCFSAFKNTDYHFKGIHGIIKNQFEGQLDTGKMMEHLLHFVHKLGVQVFNSIEVTSMVDLNDHAELNTNLGTFKSKSVVVATNGFAKELLKIKDVEPARAQVLITKPITGLKIKGAFHFDEGYYYFRNIDGRLLFGGGRNLDFQTEFTDKQIINPKIQKHLEIMLKTKFLYNIPHEIEHRWTGIMGVGKEKKPIIQTVSPNVVAAVRMGGMGVAIGSWVGKKAAALIS